MNLWRKVFCFSLLILILGSTFSAYSNANSYKLFQERRSANCAFLSFDNEDDIDIDFLDVIIQNDPAQYSTNKAKSEYTVLPSKSVIILSYLQLRVLRI